MASTAPSPEAALLTSTPDELGFAWTLLDEGLHADRSVLRGEQCGEVQPLNLEPGVEVSLEAVVDRCLGCSQCVGRAVDETSRPVPCCGVHIVGRCDLVDKADA